MRADYDASAPADAAPIGRKRTVPIGRLSPSGAASSIGHAVTVLLTPTKDLRFDISLNTVPEAVGRTGAVILMELIVQSAKTHKTR